MPEKVDVLNDSVMAAATFVDGSTVSAEIPLIAASGIVVEAVVLDVTTCEDAITGALTTPCPPHATIAVVSNMPPSNKLNCRVTKPTVTLFQNVRGPP
jgi:hypothetical protein